MIKPTTYAYRKVPGNEETNAIGRIGAKPISENITKKLISAVMMITIANILRK